jgi:integrase
VHVRLLPHLHRWRERDLKFGIRHVVHYEGRPVISVKTSWEKVRRRAGHTRRDSPHILRHTAATWQLQAGTDLYQAAGWLGMTPQTLWDVYGHHHPDYQVEAAQAVPGRRARNPHT